MEKDEDNLILSAFKNWQKGMSSQDFQTIIDISAPESEFLHLAETYRRFYSNGLNYFYEFESLNIETYSIDKLIATVSGNIKMIFPHDELNYNGCFKSNCIKIMNHWLLNDIEIEWN